MYVVCTVGTNFSRPKVLPDIWIVIITERSKAHMVSPQQQYGESRRVCRQEMDGDGGDGDDDDTEIPEIKRVRFMSNRKLWKAGIDATLHPIDDLGEIFDDITLRAMSNGFQNFLNHLTSRKLRVVTMCSGTESPLLAMEMVGKSKSCRLKGLFLNMPFYFSFLSSSTFSFFLFVFFFFSFWL